MLAKNRHDQLVNWLHKIIPHKQQSFNMLEKKKSQKAPLIKTFQLAHFLIVKIKSFNFYKDLVTSKKEVHNVDLGTAYFSKCSAQEMIMYLSKSIVLENITEPLNTGERLYFSWLFDGSSSATTIDEKKVYIIKPCCNWMLQFKMLSLEEPDDAQASGLNDALHNVLKKKLYF